MSIVINLILIVALFATGKKLNRYVAALIFGGVKAALVFWFSHAIGLTIISGAIYAVIAAGFVYFMQRLDRYPDDVPDYARSNSGPESRFKWEYVPIVILAVLMIFG